MYMIYHGINLNWTPIKYVLKSIMLRQNSIYKIMREQIPITVAESITIHKSQGSTLINVIVHISNRFMTTRLMYVACSRVTSLNGLFINRNFMISNSLLFDKANIEMEQ